MRTPVPFISRRAINPILSDCIILDDEAGVETFLTPLGRWLERRMPLIAALIAGAFLLVGYLVDRLHGPQPLSGMCVLVAFVIAGIPGLRSAWESLLERRLDIDVLMIVGAGLAAIIGQPIEGALLLFLFALSGALEEEATRRTQNAIHALRDLHPDFALVIDETGQVQRVTTRHVGPGAKLLVRPGDRVPLDGVILEGESSLDEAAITGESVPRFRTVGDPVFAGTINGSGTLTIQVTRLADDTQLARIVRMVTESQSRQARVERLFDRISPTYATIVMLAAIAFGALAPLVSNLSYRESIYRAIALLIVASPCALIIATPIAYLSAIASAARRGVLIKGGVYLEILARCRAVLFDKTGTLTLGKPTVSQVVAFDGLAEQEALRVAGALEASSSHPLASAVIGALRERELKPHEASDVEMVPGRGIRGRIADHAAALGRPELVRDLVQPAIWPRVEQVARQISEDGRTLSVVTCNGGAAVLAFEDPIRPDATETIARLRRAGIEHVAMLTGDHARVARRVAETLRLDEVHADLMPEDKIAQAERIRGRYGPIAVVGDGVNDAPMLARADVGIAMANIGSDAALEAAPIVLMSNQLERLGWLFAHGRRTARIVRQNLALALGVIVFLSGFAVAGQVQLPLAVIAHEGSTLVVALNALRLLRAR